MNKMKLWFPYNHNTKSIKPQNEDRYSDSFVFGKFDVKCFTFTLKSDFCLQNFVSWKGLRQPKGSCKLKLKPLFAFSLISLMSKKKQWRYNNIAFDIIYLFIYIF